MNFTIKCLIFFVLIGPFSSCNNENQKDSANSDLKKVQDNNDSIVNQVSQLSSVAMDDFKSLLIRYVGRKPENANHKTKFHSYFDDHYDIQFKEHQLEYYYKTETGRTYFLFTRIAPSKELKKVGIGGYVVFNSNGEIAELEEVFRTWKQVPEDLKKVTDLLFPKMVRGEDLSTYYTAKCNCTDYIEFPDEFVSYDKTTRSWESSQPDPLREFIIEKEQKMEDELRKMDSLQNLNGNTK